MVRCIYTDTAQRALGGSIVLTMTSWRDGLSGAPGTGVEHGFCYLGCGWLPFVLLFPLGIINIVAMASAGDR
jgi:predicted metal-binding membrane protein